MEIQINLHMYAYYEDNTERPTYRLWINDILHSERYYWIDGREFYIDELMFFDLEPGEHILKIEKVRPLNLGYIWYQKFQLICPTTNISIDIPTKNVKLDTEYLIPFMINNIQELDNENDERID